MVHKRIRELRENRNKQMRDIAKILNISGPAYSKIEKGDVNLSLDKIRILSSYYQVSTDWIINGKEFDKEGKNPPPEMIQEPVPRLGTQINTDYRKKIEQLETDLNLLKKVFTEYLGNQKMA